MNQEPTSNMTLDFPTIVFENESCLVIDKPAGLAVHQGGNITGVTLADLLIERYPKIIEVGDDPIRPGIVHRLDKEVNGLMVIAKTEESFINLKNQFKERKITKEYTALVHGKLLKDSDEINFAIKRSSSGHKMAAMPLNTEKLLTRRHPQSRDNGNISGIFVAKEAFTSFKVIKRLVNYTLVKVSIKTGRTHQIRVHFFAYGHPLVGDNLYSNRKTKLKNGKINSQRVFLIADHLSFTDVDGSKREFSLDLPSDLQTILAELK